MHMDWKPNPDAWDSSVPIVSLIPKREDIPKEFFAWPSKHWAAKFVDNWFFVGGSVRNAKPKKGIDQRVALRHLTAVLSDMKLEHSHKTAGVAYLVSLWFDRIELEPQKTSLPDDPSKG
jgi:hypothetical protein